MHTDLVRRHQAVHEAGHAVIGSDLGLHVDRVGFNSAEAGDGEAMNFPASTRFADAEGGPCELIGAQPAVMVVVMMAGAAAEHVVLGTQLPNSESADVGALVLCHPDLHAELPSDQKSILDAGAREAYRLAKESREEIEAVADRLMAAKELDGDDVAAIVGDIRAHRTRAL